MSKKLDLDDVVYLLSALLPSVTGAALAAMQAAGDTRNTTIEELNVYKGVGEDPREAYARGYANGESEAYDNMAEHAASVDEAVYAANSAGNHTDDSHGQFLADMDNAASRDSDEQCNDCLDNPDCSECADDGDDNPTPNGLHHRLMFKNEAGAWHANVILDDGSLDYGVIIDGPHRGKRAHRGNQGLWVVESAVDDRFRNLELDPEEVEVPEARRPDHIWLSIWEKYRRLEPEALIHRRDEITDLFDTLINVRQTGAIPGDVLFEEWQSLTHSAIQNRLANEHNRQYINLHRRIQDNPQA